MAKLNAKNYLNDYLSIIKEADAKVSETFAAKYSLAEKARKEGIEKAERILRGKLKMIK